MREAQMIAVQMPDAQKIAAVKTVTVKMAVCHLETPMTLNRMTLSLMSLMSLMSLNSNQRGPHKADWSDIVSSEW